MAQTAYAASQRNLSEFNLFIGSRCLDTKLQSSLHVSGVLAQNNLLHDECSCLWTQWMCVTRMGFFIFIYLFVSFLHSLHIPSLWEQPINDTSRSFPENSAYHASMGEQTHRFCLLLSSVCWYRHLSNAHTQLFLNLTLLLTPSCSLESPEPVNYCSIDLTLCWQFSSLPKLQHYWATSSCTEQL